jgi:DNA-directed RNA polymerase specialized sigma24 family protein
MADKPNPVATLMERVIQGDEQAAKELYERYHEPLIFIIRQRLNRSPQLRTQFDSMDFVQKVWEDILAHPEKLRDSSTLETFLKYLMGTACHEIQKAQRKYFAQKRDLRRRRHLSDPRVTAAAAAVADPRPDPAQQAAAHEV